MQGDSRVWLKGAYDSYNFGDDLILLAWIRFLETSKPKGAVSPKLYISQGHCSMDKLLDVETRAQLKRVPELLGWLRGSRDIGFLPRVARLWFYAFRLLRLFLDIRCFRRRAGYGSFSAFVDFARSLDMIHYVGGGYIAGRWTKRLVCEALTLWIIRLLNPTIRIVATGWGIGPFSTGLLGSIQRFVLRRFLSSFDAIYVRDKSSLQELVQVVSSLENAQCLGDDILLYLPELLRVSNSSPSRNRIIAVNLKDFPDYEYGQQTAEWGYWLRKLSKEKGLSLEAFAFGEPPGPDDVGLIRKWIDPNGMGSVVIHSPYREGLDEFLGRLVSARYAVGCAYHFSVIRAVASRPVISLYAGEYYRRKISEAAAVFGIRPPMEFRMAIRRPETVLEGLLEARTSSSERIERLYRSMAAVYKRLYWPLGGRSRDWKREA